MGLRICLVTPFSWSQPHDVNEHVAGAAEALRALGHEVSVLAPSNRAADLLAERRALQDGARREVIALGPAVPISRRSRIGLPVGVRANLALALARGDFDVVHGFEPGLPSLSYLALRDSRSLAVATFFSPDRLGYPPGKAQRMRLLSRIDALLAPSVEAAEAAAARFPGEYRTDSPRRRHGSLQAREEAQARRLRVAHRRAPADARRHVRVQGAAGVGARAAPDEAALRPAVDLARRCAAASASARRSPAPRALRC